MVQNRRLRRVAAGALIAVGGLLMLLSPAVHLGLAAFALGILLEIMGLAMEHRLQQTSEVTRSKIPTSTDAGPLVGRDQTG